MIKTEPYGRPDEHQHQRSGEKQPLVIETPAEYRLVDILEEFEKKKNAAQQQRDKQEIQECPSLHTQRLPVGGKQDNHHSDHQQIDNGGDIPAVSFRNPLLELEKRRQHDQRHAGQPERPDQHCHARDEQTERKEFGGLERPLALSEQHVRQWRDDCERHDYRGD